MSSNSLANKQLLIADTGPLLALARVGQLSLLSALFNEVKVTEAVWQETQAKPKRVDANAVKQALALGILSVVPNPKPSRYFSALDEGEQTALDAALLAPSATVLMDEALGRAAAKTRAISVVGSLGVLLLAKRRGLLSDIAPLIHQLKESGYRLSDSLIAKALELAGE